MFVAIVPLLTGLIAIGYLFYWVFTEVRGESLAVHGCLLPTNSILVAEKLRLGDGTRSAELAT